MTIHKSFVRLSYVMVVATGHLLSSTSGAAEPRIVSQETSVHRASSKKQYDTVSYRIAVPENRSDPQSKTIELAVLHVKSPNPQAGPPMFCLAGGPGGSSIAMVRESIFLDRELIELGDLIGVDQRGVGQSTPQMFFRDIEYAIPYDKPGDPDELLTIVRPAHAKAYARLQKLGIDPAGYNTAEAADDINDVRKLLGIDSMRIIGGSYGSHLAFSVARRHGEFVERVVIQSPEGPDHTFKLPSQVQEGLELLAERVRQDAKLGAGSRSGCDDRIGAGRVGSRAGGCRGGCAELGQQADGRRQQVRRAVVDCQFAGTQQLGARCASQRLRDGPGRLFARRTGAVRPPRQADRCARDGRLTDLASWASAERFDRIKREADTTLLGDTIDFPSYLLADAWGRHLLGDDFLRSSNATCRFCSSWAISTPARPLPMHVRYWPGCPTGTW